MVKQLAERFVEKKHRGRSGHIFLAGVLGILCNIILFGIKLSAGLIMGSLAVISDSINSLSDIGSSAITVISAKASSAKPDKEHPFGHGRIEYILTLFIAMIIFVAGAELLKTSVNRIFNPEPIEFNLIVFIILTLSLGIKFWMFSYTKFLGQKANSELLLATANDYLNDVFSTTAVILSTLVYQIFKLDIDGWAGAFVSLFIMYTGFKTAKEVIKTLIGTVPSNEVYTAVKDIILEGNNVVGVHDIVLHDYGPSRLIGTAHAEVCADCSLIDIHEELDAIEREVFERLGISIVLHLDPVLTNCKMRDSAKTCLEKVLSSYDERIRFHDFRTKEEDDKIKLIFDLVFPYDMQDTQNKIADDIANELSKINSSYQSIIQIDNR